MSDLLSGLGSLGLGSLQGMELFEDNKKEASVEEGVAEVVIDEREFLIEKTFECPICGRKFKSIMPKAAKTKLLSTDMDLRPVHENVDLTKYDVIVCQNCGYAALTIFSLFYNGIYKCQLITRQSILIAICLKFCCITLITLRNLF